MTGSLKTRSGADSPRGAGPLPQMPFGWCVVANVAASTGHGEGGREIQRGLRHYAPASLVWVLPHWWDPGHGRARTLGRHRGPGSQYIELIIAVRHLTNFRVKGVYSPALWHKMREHPWFDQAAAQEAASLWNADAGFDV